MVPTPQGVQDRVPIDYPIVTLRDHGHGRRPSPTQTAPRGGRSRDYLVGGGRSASHVPYPDLAGRHRGQAAIGATGVTGAALNSLFYRSRVQPLGVTADRRVLAASSVRPMVIYRRNADADEDEAA